MTLGKQDIKTAISGAKDVSSPSPFSKVIYVFISNTIHEFASRNWLKLQRIERYLSNIAKGTTDLRVEFYLSK